MRSKVSGILAIAVLEVLLGPAGGVQSRRVDGLGSGEALGPAGLDRGQDVGHRPQRHQVAGGQVGLAEEGLLGERPLGPQERDSALGGGLHAQPR